MLSSLAPSSQNPNPLACCYRFWADLIGKFVHGTARSDESRTAESGNRYARGDRLSEPPLQKERIEELSREMEAPDFWNDADKANAKMKELKDDPEDGCRGRRAGKPVPRYPGSDRDGETRTAMSPSSIPSARSSMTSRRSSRPCVFQRSLPGSMTTTTRSSP